MDITDLKARKKTLKLTTKDIAYRADLPFGTVSKVFTGETKNPSYVTIEKIERVIVTEEMKARLEAYVKAFTDYLEEHPDEDVDRADFERHYRKEHGLSNVPIAFAKEEDGIILHGSNALKRPDLATINELHLLGEGRNYELLDGHIIYNETPSHTHQRIVRSLGKIIDSYIETNDGNCEVFDTGFNVRLNEDDYTLVIPDLFVLCDKSKLTEAAVLGAPEWVIEVVSRSTRSYDYKEKMHKYMSAGVKEYWVVDPDKNRVVAFTEGEPMQISMYGPGEIIPVHIYDGDLKIAIEEILNRQQAKL
ncbi:MAG: Uma2 family endonuclease [Lachnospiraceae bacterium]|nr:Uma2 family endonuclease [Lachnospiraceae bacterium]